MDIDHTSVKMADFTLQHIKTNTTLRIFQQQSDIHILHATNAYASKSTMAFTVSFTHFRKRSNSEANWRIFHDHRLHVKESFEP